VIKRTLHLARYTSGFQAASLVVVASAFAISSSSPIDHERVAAANAAPGLTRMPVMAAIDPPPRDIRHAPEEEIGRETQSTPPDIGSLGAAVAVPHEIPMAVPPDAGAEPEKPDAVAPLPAVSEAQIAHEVDRYLWSVYLRTDAKFDSRGDFTWKDSAAAVYRNRSIPDYVIGGMDADFRELLFHVGRAMDAAGVRWTILSGFRDDYRQSLAVGYKAQDNNSFHGGSVATGGYGHGCAVDLASIEGGTANNLVWNWLDLHGDQFGLRRPLRGIDPAHVQPRDGWHELAAALRNQRVGPSGIDSSDQSSPMREDHTLDVGLSDEQFNCVRLPTAAPHGPDQSRRATRHFRPLIGHLAASKAAKNHAKWKNAGGAALRRADVKHSTAESEKRHAGARGSVHASRTSRRA
jgi:hypothetical protein